MLTQQETGLAFTQNPQNGFQQAGGGLKVLDMPN